MSHVTCHVSHVTCHLSHVIFLYFITEKRGGASRSRVCYKRGLPRLVSNSRNSCVRPHNTTSPQQIITAPRYFEPYYIEPLTLELSLGQLSTAETHARLQYWPRLSSCLILVEQGFSNTLLSTQSNFVL